VVVLNEFDARGGRLSSRSGATLLLTGTTCIFTVHSQAFIKFTSTRAFTEKLLFKARLYTGGAGTHTGHTGAHVGTTVSLWTERRGRHSLAIFTQAVID